MLRVAIYLCILLKICSANYYEDVVILPLPNRHTAMHFDFTFITNESERSLQHFHTFPKSIYELVHKYDVRELQLSLSRGFWDHKKWGSPFVSTSSSSAALYAWFHGNSATVDDRYKGFTDSLSGHFCASLKRMGDKKDTISPVWSFSPWGLSRSPVAAGNKQTRERQQFLRFSQMPGEPVCTENLTPWLKLLPCRQRLGLAKLLNPEVLMKSRYLSLGLQFRPVCGDSACEIIALELKLFLTVVLDHHLLGIKPHQDVDLQRLMKSFIHSSCPLADHQQLYLLLPPQFHSWSFSPQPGHLFPSSTHALGNALTLAEYALPHFLAAAGKVNVAIPTLSQAGQASASSMPVTVTKFAFGSGGKETSGIQCVIANTHSEAHFRVIWLEHLPWFMRMRFHSLRVELNGRERQPLRTHFQPSRSRDKSAHLELVLDLPPASTVRIAYIFDKLLQRWNEYPPDPSHGLYLPPSVITVRQWTGGVGKATHQQQQVGNASSADWLVRARQLPQNAATYTHWYAHSYNASTAGKRSLDVIGLEDGALAFRLFTEPVLITFPTPDFSMPFNVLCMVCTMLVMAFMSIHRHMTVIVRYMPMKSISWKQRLLQVVMFWKRSAAPQPPSVVAAAAVTTTFEEESTS